MKKIRRFILVTILIVIPLKVWAEDLSASSLYAVNGKEALKIHDNNENSYLTFTTSDKVTITNKDDIYGLYIIYELKSQKGYLETENGKITPLGSQGFLHEYVDLKDMASPIVKLNYEDNVKIGEIYVIGKGDIPDYVEIWEEPCPLADLVLFSTHSDDEQLFFLGLLPTYVARQANVEVIYFTNHYDNPRRLHEQLHGLYTVGIRNYPIIGPVPDAWSETLEGALTNLQKAQLTEKDALDFEVEMLRRFKPQVVVGHDELGEYSHGQHILNTYILKQALEKANNPDYHEESYHKYGLWNTPKTYLHLYKENKIIMDYDTPLEYFDGLTAYEVSKKGYSKHLSQQYTWFTAWMNGKRNEYTKSTDIKKYSPNEFGLYRSLVGDDLNKNDMFENLTLRKDEIIEDESVIKEEKPKEKEQKKKNVGDIIKDYQYYILGLLGLIFLVIILVKIKALKK